MMQRAASHALRRAAAPSILLSSAAASTSARAACSSAALAASSASRPLCTLLARTPLRASPSASSPVPSPSRSFHASAPSRGLEEFFMHQQAGRTGRAWNVRDLRIKSFADLRALWFILLKERNMLYTYKHQCASMRENMEDPHRIRKVRQSMKAIKVVLGERYREFKTQTDPIWLKRQNALAARRLSARVHLRRKRGVPLGRRPRDGPGLALWQKSKHQKYAFLKPRPEGVAPPKGTFPEEMQREQTHKGHGQAPSDLLNVKSKQEKIYF